MEEEEEEEALPRFPRDPQGRRRGGEQGRKKEEDTRRKSFCVCFLVTSEEAAAARDTPYKQEEGTLPPATDCQEGGEEGRRGLPRSYKKRGGIVTISPPPLFIHTGDRLARSARSFYASLRTYSQRAAV